MDWIFIKFCIFICIDNKKIDFFIIKILKTLFSSMTSSFENLNRVELLRKRETLYYYIEKINKELEKRDAKQTINDRLDRDLKEIEKANTNPVALAFKKMIRKGKSKKKVENEPVVVERIVYLDREDTPEKSKSKKKQVQKSKQVKTKPKEDEPNTKKKKPTISIIKKGLNNKKIKYKKSAKKDELMEIVRKNNLVRYVESLC